MKSMNIKGLGGVNLNQPQMNPVNKIDQTIKSDTAHDRDANGRQDPNDKKQDQKPKKMNTQEFEKALSHLRSLAVVQEHKWVIEIEHVQDQRFILVKDNLGTVIRRIPELDLWTLNLSDEVVGKGHLLHKAA
jgi:hypothetical protein